MLIKKKIIIKNAKENNLKNISLIIPKNKFIIITGISGSGKSSLAFDTLYAEGQRKYIESLSIYARQFLGNLKKANVEKIVGLSPTIAINQKSNNNNPRSTVGTITEIYDYIRLLYARAGTPYCPFHNIKISSNSVDKIAKFIVNNKKITYFEILSPVIINKKGSFKKLLLFLKKKGFLRIYINNQKFSLEKKIILNKNKKYFINIIIDRIKNEKSIISRISDSLSLALKYSNGIVYLKTKKKLFVFSIKSSCYKCNFSIENIEPRLFSFNTPIGACEKCKGLGFIKTVDLNRLIPDSSLTILEGGIKYYKNIVNTKNFDWQLFKNLVKFAKIDLNSPIKNISKKKLNIILYGSKIPINYKITSFSGYSHICKKKIEGIITMIERRYHETSSTFARDWYSKFLNNIKCNSCNGKRLKIQALSVKINGLDIIDFTKIPISNLMKFIKVLKFNKKKIKIVVPIVKEIYSRLKFLKDVGLQYLSLNRNADTLSGGEFQRIRLATQIGSTLTGILYILDEPSIGLHQKDNYKLIKTLKKIRDLGNTVIVVEHDIETLKACDWLIDIGPGAGKLGGKIVISGKLKNILKKKNLSLTVDFLKGIRNIEIPKKRRSGNGNYIKIFNACKNNLKNINVVFPLGTFISVTGVSGSGKSSLINEILCKMIQKNINKKKNIISEKHGKIIGIKNIKKIIVINQKSIGKTPRSNPATYIGIFDYIRKIFSLTNKSKIFGFSKSHFSFNLKGGRCETCKGSGIKCVSMHFLPDVYIRCENCNGKRYSKEILKIKYKNKNIYDVLNMSVSEAMHLFNSFVKIKNGLKVLKEVGLGYIKLGQFSTTLSGGEAQRIKLANELQKKFLSSEILYILDEPTTGLHCYDVKKLILVLQKLVNNNNTVIVIEHNLDLIKNSDYIIDLGPEGGNKGGKIIAYGKPEEIIKIKKSYTGKYLKKILKLKNKYEK